VLVTLCCDVCDESLVSVGIVQVQLVHLSLERRGTLGTADEAFSRTFWPDQSARTVATVPCSENPLLQVLTGNEEKKCAKTLSRYTSESAASVGEYTIRGHR